MASHLRRLHGLRGRLQFGPQRGIVGRGEVDEAVEPGRFRTAQRVRPHEVDVVGQRHEIADLELRVDPAGCVRQQQRPDPQRREHAGRERGLRQVEALVEVGPARQDRHRDSQPLADDEAAGVARDRADRETRQVAVRELATTGDGLGDRAEAAAEHDPEPRPERSALGDERGGGGGIGEAVLAVHRAGRVGRQGGGRQTSLARRSAASTLAALL